MVWGAFLAKGHSLLAQLEGNQNARNFIETLENYLLPFVTSMHPNGYVFQQDNASIHTAGYIQDWLAGQNISFVDWAAKSPDLNPI